MLKSPISCFILSAGLMASPFARSPAQQEAVIEAIAPILMAEDARLWSEAVFRRGLEHPDPQVRRTAAMAVGRVKDPRGTSLLVSHLRDPDSTVQTHVMFALGLMQDSAAVGPILARFTAEPGLWRETAREGITAVGKIGGPAAAGFFAGILRGTQNLTVDSVPLVRIEVAREVWRLGAAAPVSDLIAFLSDTLIELRQVAVYSAGRLRARGAGEALLLALRDDVGLIRSWAARALTKAYADTAGLSNDAVVAGLRRLLADDDTGVQISALRSLGSFRRPDHSIDVAPLLEDPDVNVRVQAAATLGLTGGPIAREALADVLRSREVFAIRREALLSAAKAELSLLKGVTPSWEGSDDWRERAALAEAWATTEPSDSSDGLQKAALLGHATADPDPRVIAAALQARNGRAEPDSNLAALARVLVGHGDAAVRSVAADILARVKRPKDIPILVSAYRLSARDSFPEAALSTLAALRAIAEGDGTAASAVERDFLDVVPRPASYLIRRWAESSWPRAAERWGPAYPIETGRTLEDYRELARRYVVGNDPARYPRVFLETERRGTMGLELFGPEAPLTVANFLRLVDRHFFDGNSWHRVVPNFVVQDGDPRGDGWGGPGGEIRDEINRRRYAGQVLGMAMSGPDTGSSQWFITHSPQPHLDGTYTVFGRVVSGGGALTRISQGDRIITIRR